MLGMFPLLSLPYSAADTRPVAMSISMEAVTTVVKGMLETHTPQVNQSSLYPIVTATEVTATVAPTTSRARRGVRSETVGMTGVVAVGDTSTEMAAQMDRAVAATTIKAAMGAVEIGEVVVDVGGDQSKRIRRGICRCRFCRIGCSCLTMRLSSKM